MFTSHYIKVNISNVSAIQASTMPFSHEDMQQRHSPPIKRTSSSPGEAPRAVAPADLTSPFASESHIASHGSGALTKEESGTFSYAAAAAKASGTVA